MDIGQPNNQWYDVIYNYLYDGIHTFQLKNHGTYRITVVYVISGSGGEADTITQTMTKTYLTPNGLRAMESVFIVPQAIGAL